MMTTLTRSTTSTSLRRTLRNSPMVSPLLRQIDSLLEKAIGGRATPIVPTSADPKQIIYIGVRAGALQDLLTFHADLKRAIKSDTSPSSRASLRNTGKRIAVQTRPPGSRKSGGTEPDSAGGPG